MNNKSVSWIYTINKYIIIQYNYLWKQSEKMNQIIKLRSIRKQYTDRNYVEKNYMFKLVIEISQQNLLISKEYFVRNTTYD